MNKKGFTLIEIIVAFAILGMLSAIVVNSFGSIRVKKEQEAITQGILAALEKQKADTQAGKGGSNYGIKFNEDSYVLYKGTNYDANDETNQEVIINPEFTLSNTLTSSADTIYFSKIYGEASEDATITVSHINDELTPQVIAIEESGTISVIE